MKSTLYQLKGKTTSARQKQKLRIIGCLCYPQNPTAYQNTSQSQGYIEKFQGHYLQTCIKFFDLTSILFA